MTKTRSLCLLVLAVACGGRPPSNASFTLKVPPSVPAAPGASAFIDVTLERAQGYTGSVTLTADAKPLTATVSNQRVRIDVPLATRGKQPVTITGTGDDGQTATATTELAIAEPYTSPTKPVGISVKLDALFYASGAPAKVTVDYGANTPPSTLPDVVLVSSESHDVEKLKLMPAGGNVFVTEPANITASDASATALDGAFTLPGGGVFFAMLAIDRTQPGYETFEASSVSDFAFVDGERPESPKSRVEASLKLTADEDVVPAGGRAVGTLFRIGTEEGDGMPVQLATEELIVMHADDAELQRFLAASNGTLLVTQPTDGEKPFASLVKVDPLSLSPARLALLRGFLSDRAELLASKPEVQGIYGLAMVYRLEGFIVSVNPRLSYHSVQNVAEPEPTNLSDSMKMKGRAGSLAQCVPGDASRRCALDAPAVWTYLDLLDLDSQRVKVAVLDMGFAPNADFRTNADGGIDQCDMTGRGMRCGAGAALGSPTVGASLVGDRIWHGTGVVTTLGGVVDNAFGGAGVAGQVAVPMLYKYDLASYAFDMGAGIRHAVDHGAQVVNVSAGYPCKAVLTVGPELEYCSIEGRAGICAIVTAAAHAAAIAFCTSPAAGIPIVGAAVCIGFEVAAVAATDACLSTLALGNVRAPMASAVAYALSRGVPVVASAGNVLDRASLPEVLRDVVNLDERRTEHWGIVPATLPGVIAAGAARTEDLGNSQFFGDRVDFWAPEPTHFMAPMSTDDPASPLHLDGINATSAAAPYISGTIAAMMAVNPSLDPARATAAERMTGVSRIRSILSSTAFTNAQLVTLGWKNDPVERRNLIDPLAAVLEAARGAQPDLAALGFDTHLNYDEGDFSDDTAAGARSIAFGTPVPGTVFAFSGAPLDQDWKTFTVPTLAGRVFSTDLTLEWVGNDEPVTTSPVGMPALQRISTSLTGTVKSTTYRAVRASASVVQFAVTSRGSEDAPYKVTVATPVPMDPVLAIVNPVVPAGSTLCANIPTTFRATGTYPGSTLTVSSVEWLIDGLLQPATALTTTFTRPVGTDVFTVRAFGATAAMTVTFVTCTATAQILTPSANVMQYWMLSDANGGYLPIDFTARALDSMGMVINPSTLVFEWTTNRGELQPGAPTSGPQLLGTGPSLLGVRLYGAAGSPSETHTITLTIRASAGGPVLSTDNILVTWQNLI